MTISQSYELVESDRADLLVSSEAQCLQAILDRAHKALDDVAVEDLTSWCHLVEKGLKLFDIHFVDWACKFHNEERVKKREIKHNY